MKFNVLNGRHNACKFYFGSEFNVFHNKGGRGNKLCVYDKSWLSCYLGIFEKWSNDKEYWCKLVNCWLIVRYIACLMIHT